MSRLRRTRSVRFSRISMLLTLVAGCAGPESATPPPIDGTPITLLEYVAVAPTPWTAKQPSSSMRIAEYDIPAAAGEEAGELIVYFFGAGQGGSVEANVERWTGQFANEDGTHPQAVTTQLDGLAFPTTVVELRGRYARNVGMGGGATEAKPDQVLLAGIVETPRGNIYVQMHGPSATVLAQKDAFTGFVRSVRPHTPVS